LIQQPPAALHAPVYRVRRRRKNKKKIKRYYEREGEKKKGSTGWMDGWIYRSIFPRRENVHIAYRRMRFFRRGSDLDACSQRDQKGGIDPFQTAGSWRQPPLWRFFFFFFV
jgi:hypothetical protein